MSWKNPSKLELGKKILLTMMHALHSLQFRLEWSQLAMEVIS